MGCLVNRLGIIVGVCAVCHKLFNVLCCIYRSYVTVENNSLFFNVLMFVVDKGILLKSSSLFPFLAVAYTA